MIIELTEEQIQALNSALEEPIQVVDPRSRATFYLLSAKDYESVREILDEEKARRALGPIARRNAIGRMNEKP